MSMRRETRIRDSRESKRKELVASHIICDARRRGVATPINHP